jgi:hypothetical protein
LASFVKLKISRWLWAEHCVLGFLGVVRCSQFFFSVCCGHTQCVRNEVVTCNFMNFDRRTRIMGKVSYDCTKDNFVKDTFSRNHSGSRLSVQGMCSSMAWGLCWGCVRCEFLPINRVPWRRGFVVIPPSQAKCWDDY